MPRPGARRALTNVADLIASGLAASADAPALQRVATDFQIRIPPQMAAAAAGAVDGPVARQFVPTAAELVVAAGSLHDPIGDAAHQPAPGLTHRYPDRVILHVTRTCDVYCRFCFRREVVGESGPLPEPELAAALAYIRATPAIREVILTGGDPLTLSPRRLAALCARIAGIGHIEVLRIHSRTPVVAPERTSPALIAVLKSVPVLYLVIHTNHADELTPAAVAALARLADAGIPLLSQTVLLRRVNDSAEALAALFRALLRHRVKPYYLHHCDLARGTGHFRTTIAEGQRIMAELRGRLSGLCLPGYVIDIPGGFGKVPVLPGYVEETGIPGRYMLRDHQGRLHPYADPEG
ncbi:MAG: lysine-2,3-aminomutase-like protein [Phaeovulum sp.]|uniref:lysine-2,3-aminomutase-like protein n=1 Tax=Phaeovulum sp. TaxID=2934796 RepID=UPI00272F06AF|nr:lysine-2,3-aminomutase-like protein [Phaeovulum sp.]MDP2062471.1 lysine-2,3-aminomutase-like protein [Phaeovulum sp.]